MSKESSMSFVSIIIGLVVVFFNVFKSVVDTYLLALLIVSVVLAFVALMLAISNKRKIKAKRDKYIFAIILSSLALVFNVIMLISTVIFVL